MTDCWRFQFKMLFKEFRKNRFKISVVVAIYNMQREAPRTLFSLSVPYQQGVSKDDYEVIVVDNASTEPLSAAVVTSFGSNFRYFFFPTTSKSPAAAVNFGVSKARGKYVGLMVDGARIVSPGIIKYALAGMKLFPNPVVATLGFHLGPDVQFRSVAKGYNREAEDALLESVDWISNGYRLFEIASFAGSSKDGFFLPIGESNCFFLKREAFEQLGGFDERFKTSGGGLVNLDLYKRACELTDSVLVILLGEGTFHQLHGGVSTNVTEEENLHRWCEFEKEYIEIRHASFLSPDKVPEFIGHIPDETIRFIKMSANQAISRQRLT